MFKGLGDMANLMKQLGNMQQIQADVQAKLQEKRIEGSAGAGMVTVEVNGLQQVLKCEIAPSLLEQNDKEMIEDLIVSAMNQALDNAKEANADALKESINIPGLSDMLGGNMPGFPPS